MIGGLSLLAGVLLGLAAAAIPSPTCRLAGAVVALITMAVLIVFRYRGVGVIVSRALAMTLLGAVLASQSVATWMRLRVEPDGAGARVLLEGRVLGVPEHAGGEVRFLADVRAVDGGMDARPRRMRLAWRNSRLEPRVGERWRWLVRLEPLVETRNFAGFDAGRAAFRDGVHAAGRVLPSALDERLELASASIDTARALVAWRVRDAIADPDAAALVTALVVGLTDDVTPDQWRIFNATGTTHLVAISGLHVTLFALIAFAAARGLWRRMPLRARIPRETFAGLLGLSAAGAYSLLAGLSVPTLRTWLMLATFAFARLVARHAGPGRIWSLALIAVLLADPRAPLSAGFWLSFVAVGVILAVAPAVPRGWRAHLSAALRLQFAVMLALAPLTVAVFSSVSIGGFLVNLVAIPFVSFVFVPVVLAGAVAALCVPAIATFVFQGAEWLYHLTWPALAWAADAAAPWKVSPPAWWFALAGFAVVLALRGGVRWLRMSALCAALPLLFPPSRLPPPATVRVLVFDAGRGAMSLLLTRSFVLLFDTGDAWHTDGARVRQLLAPALDSLGVRGVDLVILPELSAERAAAVASLAGERGVGAIVVGGGWTAPRLPADRCVDTAFERDGVRLETLAAAGADGSRACALRVSVGSHTLLLATDVAAFAKRTPAPDAAIVTRAEWIGGAAPGLAIATGGIAESRSRAALLERWRAQGIAVLDTRRDGAIDLVLGTLGVESRASAARDRYPFAWRRAP